MIAADLHLEHVAWSAHDCRRHGDEPILASHRLHDSAGFGDDGLIDLLDELPRADLEVFAMDASSDEPDRWVPVDATDASGHDLLDVARRRRLWLNLVHVDRVHGAIRSFVAEEYARLSARVPALERYVEPHATLTISSAGAVRGYHFDPLDTMLWQIRGTKQVWIYPVAMRHLVTLDRQEAIFALAVDDEVPYEPSFDVHARHLEVRPGDVLSWPHGAPHRSIGGASLDVSLATSVVGLASARRQATYAANRYLRRHTPVRRLSTETEGWRPAAKRFAHRVAGRVYDPGAGERPERWTHLAIDASAPDGLAISDRPIRAHFDRRDS